VHFSARFLRIIRFPETFMLNSHSLLCSAILGSALAAAAHAPAFAGDTSVEASKRMRALHGDRAVANASTHASSAVAAKGWKYKDVYRFKGGAGDGCNSGAKVTFAPGGTLYGTTDFCGPSGNGVVFELAPDGTETVLHFFTGGADGAQPDGAVTRLANGDLVGTTTSGGPNGSGTLFKITKKGKFKVLHAFTSTDGSLARGNLHLDEDGNFYGTALFGGANGAGTVFKYAADGTFSVLHAFTGGADGQFPEHGVVADSAGNLFGVTAFGGAHDNGSVFKIDAAGNFSTVYSFTGGADGGFLYGGLAIDSEGTLYGSTGNGGANSAGTVFKLTQDGTLTTLYDFTGGADGASPEGDMLLVGKNLYSTAYGGGDPSCLCGLVYEVTAKGKQKVLHTFTGTDGSGYSAGLTLNEGVFYGTVQYGADLQNGAVYSLKKK
jgi:uncharacterized repeat protein (TIGR03803 family)